MQRLKQKILNLEEQVTISKEKEMDIMRDYEQEKLRTLHNQSFERVCLLEIYILSEEMVLGKYPFRFCYN